MERRKSMTGKRTNCKRRVQTSKGSVLRFKLKDTKYEKSYKKGLFLVYPNAVDNCIMVMGFIIELPQTKCRSDFPHDMASSIGLSQSSIKTKKN